MKKIKQASIYVLGLALAVSIFPLSTYAETTTEQTVTEARCTLAEKNITAHITNITKEQTERSAKYAAITTRINTLVTSATAANYPNVSKLTAARDSVTSAINTFTAQATTYKTALETAQTTTCGNNGGKFVDALKAVRTELVTLRTDSIAVKTAVTQQAVPALHDYATWLKTNPTTAKESQ